MEKQLKTNKSEMHLKFKHMKKIAIPLILLSLLFLSNPFLTAQEISHFEPEQFKNDATSGHYHYWEVKLHSGSHPNTSKYIEELLSAGYRAVEVRVGTQSSGRQLWQQVHDLPQYGVGFYLANLGENQLDTIVGTPSGLFGYIGLPIYRKGKFRFNTDLSAGVSYDFRPYDAETNPYNDVIGSWMNVYFNVNFVGYWQISERTDLSFGFDATHFSNGRTRTPNKGMNLMGVNIGMAYNFSPMNTFNKKPGTDNKYPIRAPFNRRTLPTLDKYSEINFFGTIGTSTTSGNPAINEAGPRYFNSSWGVDFARRFWWRGKYVIGTDIFYDGSLVEGYEKPHSEVTGIEKMSFGIHVGHDMLFERITLVTQMGWYVYKKSSERGSWYIRAGGKIALNEKWSAHVALKTMNGGIADWIEWGMVYSLRLKK